MRVMSMTSILPLILSGGGRRSIRRSPSRYNVAQRSFELLLYHVVVDHDGSGERGDGEVSAGGVLGGMRILAKHQPLHSDHGADAGAFQGDAASAKLTILRSQERVGF